MNDDIMWPAIETTEQYLQIRFSFLQNADFEFSFDKTTKSVSFQCRLRSGYHRGDEYILHTKDEIVQQLREIASANSLNGYDSDSIKIEQIHRLSIKTSVERNALKEWIDV
jgi:hypothetical protein